MNLRGRRRLDHYYWKARREGYRSRAAYKLLQINKKFKVIRSGYVVVDLGAAPGGWSQVALEIIGPRGFVLAVDIGEMRPLPAKNFGFLRMDITSMNAADRILAALGGIKADVVLCDAAPNVSGVWVVDHVRQIRLVEAAFKIALAVLRSGGNFVVKIFQGPDSNKVVSTMSRYFRVHRVYKPRASRKRSAEIYFIGKGLEVSVAS